MPDYLVPGIAESLAHDPRADPTPFGARCPARWLVCERALVQPLHDHGHSLAAGDAHGLQADLLVVALQVVQQRCHDARSGHAEAMTGSDRAAVRVELL